MKVFLRHRQQRANPYACLQRVETALSLMVGGGKLGADALELTSVIAQRVVLKAHWQTVIGLSSVASM
jgi:hypothetical protein